MQLFVDVLNNYFLTNHIQLNVVRLLVWAAAIFCFRFLWLNYRRIAWAGATHIPQFYFILIIIFALLYVD
jgi:hypothetical protein